MRLEEAIRKMTSLPAQRFGLARPRAGAARACGRTWPCSTPATVADRATFEAPHAPSHGFRYVLVNGEVVVEDGRHTGARAGRVLAGPGAGS